MIAHAGITIGLLCCLLVLLLYRGQNKATNESWSTCSDKGNPNPNPNPNPALELALLSLWKACDDDGSALAVRVLLLCVAAAAGAAGFCSRSAAAASSSASAASAAAVNSAAAAAFAFAAAAALLFRRRLLPAVRGVDDAVEGTRGATLFVRTGLLVAPSNAGLVQSCSDAGG